MLKLKPHIAFCSVNGQTIFMDAEGDAYFMLPPADQRLFTRYRQGEVSDDEVSRAAGAALAGILIEGDPCDVRPRSMAYCPGRRQAGREGRPSAALVALAVGSQAITALTQQRRSLRQRLASIRARKARRPAASRADLSAALAAVRAFQISSRFAAANNRCLDNAFGMADYLALFNYYPDIVFGVRTDPFAAHCWVQDGDFVLNDMVEKVGEYVPILVV